MSTNIADLPGPTEEEYDNNTYEENYENTSIQERNVENENENENEDEPKYNYEKPKFIEKNELYEQPTKIKMDIKKLNQINNNNNNNNTQEKGIFDIVTGEVTEENLLILIILYIASSSLLDEYVKHILTMISFNISNFNMNIAKAIGLLLLFIIFKIFLLPYIRV